MNRVFRICAMHWLEPAQVLAVRATYLWSGVEITQPTWPLWRAWMSGVVFDVQREAPLA